MAEPDNDPPARRRETEMMNPMLIRNAGESGFSAPVAVQRPTGDRVAQVRVAGNTEIPVGQTGIWECSPGRFRRQVPQAEYSYFISGHGSFTPDGGEPIKFKAGDAVYFAANTEGEWDILETVTKAYVIFA